MNEEQKLEDRIQQEMFEWYQNTYCLAFHNPRFLIAHVPNQNQQKLVKIGVLPGFSDLLIIHGKPAVHYYFEVKTPFGNQSPAQRVFQSRVEELGYSYYIVRTLEEFKYIVLSLPM